MRTSFHPCLAPLPRPLLHPPLAPLQLPLSILPLPQSLKTPATMAFGVHQHNGRTLTLARQNWKSPINSNQAGIKLVPNRVAGDSLITSRMAGTSTLQASRHFGKTLSRISGKAAAGISLMYMLRAFGSSLRREGSRAPGTTSSRAVGKHPNRLASISRIRALGTSLIQIPLC